MLKKLKALFAIMITLGMLHSHTYGKSYEVQDVLYVYDGDTFRANLLCGEPIICNNVAIRLSGVDTPELRDKRGDIKKMAMLAKAFTIDNLKSSKKIELRNVSRGKYFRLVAEVYVDGSNLNEMLIRKGLAKRYTGKTRKPW